jgi:hypothetical protein
MSTNKDFPLSGYRVTNNSIQQVDGGLVVTLELTPTNPAGIIELMCLPNFKVPFRPSEIDGLGLLLQEILKIVGAQTWEAVVGNVVSISKILENDGIAGDGGSLTVTEFWERYRATKNLVSQEA